MEKNIKDYLHLYLGCTLRSKTGFVKLLAVIAEVIPNTSWGIVVLNGSESYRTELGDYLPELRPLPDMTEEEGMNVYKLLFPHHTITDESTTETVSYSEALESAIHYCLENSTPETTRYLLSKHFDLFGLIESGLAIDKTKIQQPN